MSNPSRRKGDHFEREVAKIFGRHGLDAKRTPMSGAIVGWEGDVIVKIGDRKERIECKRRASGFKGIYGWLGANYLLAMRDDNCEPLILIRAEDFANLCARIPSDG
jgi:hypothetical protein